MPRDNLGLFSPSDIRLIRAQAASGTLNVRGWSAAKRVSPETIRRIARRDTYASIPDEPVASGADEPSAEALAASLARLTATAQALPPQRGEVLDLLDDLAKRGGPQ